MITFPITLYAAVVEEIETFVILMKGFFINYAWHVMLGGSHPFSKISGELSNIPIPTNFKMLFRADLPGGRIVNS